MNEETKTVEQWILSNPHWRPICRDKSAKFIEMVCRDHFIALAEYSAIEGLDYQQVNWKQIADNLQIVR